MQLKYPAHQIHNPLQILRKAGYKHFVDPVTKKESYVLQLTNGYYPRFHLYIMNEGDGVVFDLHLDQKKPSYAGTKAHGGEYDGTAVEKEISRIDGWASHIIGAPTQVTPVITDTVDNPAPEENNIEPEVAKSEDLFQGIFNQ